MRRLSLSMIVLLMTILSISGQSLPKIVLVNNATNILISPAQLKFANTKIAESKYLTERTERMKTVIDNYNNNLRLQAEYTWELQNENKAIQEQMKAYKNIIDIQADDVKTKKKKARKEKIRAIFISGGVGIIIGLVISII